MDLAKIEAKLIKRHSSKIVKGSVHRAGIKIRCRVYLLDDKGQIVNRDGHDVSYRIFTTDVFQVNCTNEANLKMAEHMANRA